LLPQLSVKRLSLILWSASLFVVLIIGHLFRIQVIQHENYLSEAEKQHKQRIDLPPKRGNIFDRNGEPLALSADGLDVYAVPDRIKDKKRVARLLSSQLQLPENTLLKRISSSRPFVMIQQKVNPLTLEEFQQKSLEGIGFIPSSKRYYPRHSLAAQVIGYVGIDEEGLTGVEFMYDSQLRGKPGWLIVQRDAKGKPYNVLDYPLRNQTNGYHLRLTIDAEFQEIVEDVLQRSVNENGAKNGCVVAINPHNGEILALANYPSVNLNSSKSFKETDFLNLAANLPYEPGSTFKTFIASALLASGCVDFDDSVYCENGVCTFNKRTIRDVHGYGKLSFSEVISKSSNIGMAKLIRRISDQELYRKLRAFGFGSYTGGCFSGEDKGQLALPAEWDPTTKTSLAIGYSIMVTPLQMAMAYAAIANGGILYEPELVAEIFDEQGNSHYSFKPRALRRVLTEETTRKLTRQALIQVVESGTGKAAAVPGFKVAGKTGTSMKATPGSGYDGNGYISSFGGFFPADDPQIAMFITINEPNFSYRWGGTCAAPVFSEIIRNTLLSDCEVIDRSRLRLPEPQIKTASAVIKSPVLKEQPPQTQASTFKKARDGSSVVMPEVTGLSIRKAVARIKSLGLNVRVTGGIRVLEQSPKPGTLLASGALTSLTGLPTGYRNNSISMAARTVLSGENVFFLQQINGEEQ